MVVSKRRPLVIGQGVCLYRDCDECDNPATCYIRHESYRRYLCEHHFKLEPMPMLEPRARRSSLWDQLQKP
jgi:hypothetical protein